LRLKVEAAGFHIDRTTSFVTLLLPAMLLSRLVQKQRHIQDYDPTAELKLPRWLNWLFYSILRVEIMLIKSGIDLPFGGSRLIVATKTLKPAP
jgi:hypothetical protein